MGTSLTGLTPSTTYDALIKVGDNGPITSTLKTLSDGLGNDLPMEASTTAINFTGTLTQSGTTLQPTLVSGTNIKTINGTSVLGSGNIVTPTTSPSGVAGAIQFSNGSAFASDASNFFWDNTNKRLGIGTNAPTQTLDVRNTGTGAIFFVQNNAGSFAFGVDSAGGYGQAATVGKGVAFYNNAGTSFLSISGSGGTGINILNPSAAFHIKGSGSTDATTSLLVQNSGGTQWLKLQDNGLFTLGADKFIVSGADGYTTLQYLDCYNFANFRTQVSVGSASLTASAQLSVDSTTRGFLPPRMTTTQKNNIASPAAGLVVYDSTTNKLCCYDGSTWNDLF